MANVASATKDHEKLVKIKYIPLKENYKGYVLPVSVTTGGRQYSAQLVPRQWTTVPWCIAKMLKDQVKKQRKPRYVPDGRYMEEGPNTRSEGGVMFNVREENEPDYEIEVDSRGID